MSKKTYGILSLAFALCTLLCLAMIFHYGAQSSSNSMEASDKIVEKVKIVAKATNNPDIANTKRKRANLSNVVRKSAHAAEFFALGISSMLLMVCFYGAFGRKYVFFPLALCLATAVADEYIQGKVGRSSNVSDVILDICGAVAGIVAVGIVILIIKIIKKFKKS